MCVRGVVDDPFCNECGELETIQHFFVECHEVRVFWDNVVARINSKVKPCYCIEGNANDVIFGVLNTRRVVNLIILIAKQFIVSRRFKEEQVCLEDFIPFLARHYYMEKIIATKKHSVDNFKAKWIPFIGNDLQITI